MELAYRPFFHYLITNDNVEKATQTLNSIIWAERAKRELRLSKLADHHPIHPIVQTVCLLMSWGNYYIVESSLKPLQGYVLENEYPSETAYRLVKQLIQTHTLNNLQLPEAWAQTYIEPLYVSYESHSHHEEQIHWFKLDLPNEFDLASLPSYILTNRDELIIPNGLRGNLA